MRTSTSGEPFSLRVDRTWHLRRGFYCEVRIYAASSRMRLYNAKLMIATTFLKKTMQDIRDQTSRMVLLSLKTGGRSYEQLVKDYEPYDKTHAERGCERCNWQNREQRD